MKKNIEGSTYNNDNSYAASHKNYRPKFEGMSDGNWFADHKKLLWGIGGAVALGAGAFIYLKNKNASDKYSDTYDEMNALNQSVLNDNLDDNFDEEILITTITEVE